MTPLGTFVLVCTALGLSETACSTASIILVHGWQRFHINGIPPADLPGPNEWLVIMALLAAPVVGFCLWFSIRQHAGLWQPKQAVIRNRPVLRIAASYILAAVAALAIGLAFAWFLLVNGHSVALHALEHVPQTGFEACLESTGLFVGYVDSAAHPDPLVDHVAAGIALACVLLMYGALGVYGWFRLGKGSNVPALASALMPLILLTWILSGSTFFFDAWRIPTVLIVVAIGFVTAQSKQSDHFYDLQNRAGFGVPTAAETLSATDQERIIIVAANGGGIQSSAWATQVLSGLLSDCGDAFRAALRMISSVSGGSVGAVYFVNFLAHPQTANNPVDAASASSLDELAWGLAWPDFLRAFLPCILGGLIGRGRALERAWSMNGIPRQADRKTLDNPLSSWNAPVATGEIPAVILNSTVAETGKRLLLATTDVMGNGLSDRAKVDATKLHFINGHALDVGIVTAARLSATFPYVLPASRAKTSEPMPHIVDGGYYDNYGMASLVDWLDEGLTKCSGRIKSVLVLQIHGSRIETDVSEEPRTTSRGWFYQLFAPITTLMRVRDSGQIAHNDIELGLLQQKWFAERIPIHTVTFEFDTDFAPLSWHLTPEEVAAITNVWSGDMGACRALVKDFLSGSDDLHCGCPACGP